MPLAVDALAVVPVIRDSFDRLMDSILHPAVRLTARGKVSRWNAAAAVRFGWLAKDRMLGDIAPAAVVAELEAALAADGDDVALTNGWGRLLRLSARDRLWISDPPQADAFADMSAALVWEYDGVAPSSADDLRLVAANAASEMIGGQQPMRSLLGRQRREMQQVESLSDVYIRVARTGQREVVRDLRGLDGRLYDADVFAMPPNRLAVSFYDVTLTRTSEHGYRRMFERSHDAILIIDATTALIADANPVAQAAYGRTRAELVGQPVTGFAQHARADIMGRVLQAGSLRFETIHLRPDGTKIYFEVHANSIDYQGTPAVMAIMRDVTEQTMARLALAASEERYRALVTNVPVVLWTITAELESMFLSPSVAAVTGFPAEEMTGTSKWWDRMEPRAVARITEAITALFRDGTPFDVEYRYCRKDGSWVWLAAQATHTYEEDGRQLMDGVTQDVTERKRGELQQIGLAGFGRRAVTETDIRALMQDACTTIAEVLEVPMASVLLYVPEENRYRVMAAHGMEVPDSFRVPNEPDRLVAKVVTSDRPLTYDLMANPGFNATDMLALGTRAGVVAPISAGAARYGILHAHTTEPRKFSPRDEAFVQSMANVLAEAMQRGSAGRELERREAQLSDAQSIAHIGSLEIDVETGAMHWSDELYRIAGLEPQSRPVTAELVAELVPPEVNSWFLSWGELLADGDVIDSEYIMFRADNRQARTVRARARKVLDRITGRWKIIGTLQDVTDYRDAEAALLDRERRLQLIVARLPVILWSTDNELRVNSLTGAGFGASNDRAIGSLDLSLRDLIGTPPAASRKRLESALAGMSVTFDTKHGQRDLRVNIEPLRDERGAIVGTVGIAFDTTEERRAARHNRNLMAQLRSAAAEWRDTFDSIRAPLVIVDHQGNVARMNSAALECSRFTRYAQAIGQPVSELGKDAIWSDVEAIASASASHHKAISLQGGDRDGRAWDLLASPAAGRHTIVIASDVTELVRMQERLLRSERMSEMGALVAGVAHEVRNPLFGISATLDAFEKKHGLEQFGNYIGALREQVDRMSQLMHELLEYGRPLAAVLEPACIAVVVNTAVAAAGTLAAAHGVTVLSRVPPSLVEVPMDRPRMLQVFDNLLANAIQHSDYGAVVEVSAEVVDQQTVRIAIEDRGPGFDTSDMPRLFEPFFTRRRGGTGLGLSLVRRIIEEHNGKVAAANREGGGAVMIVTLPVSLPVSLPVAGGQG